MWFSVQIVISQYILIIPSPTGIVQTRQPSIAVCRQSETTRTPAS
jgi:hypothetical protein